MLLDRFLTLFILDHYNLLVYDVALIGNLFMMVLRTVTHLGLPLRR
jgi:hypothetical protein